MFDKSISFDIINRIIQINKYMKILDANVYILSNLPLKKRVTVNFGITTDSKCIYN